MSCEVKNSHCFHFPLKVHTCSRLPVTRTFYNSNLPLTRSNFCFPSDHFPYNFTLDNPKSRSLELFSFSLKSSNYRKSTISTWRPMPVPFHQHAIVRRIERHQAFTYGSNRISQHKNPSVNTKSDQYLQTCTEKTSLRQIVEHRHQKRK